MRPIETATNTFADGFNCAQAILTAFTPRFDLNRETALRLGTAFGGGMAQRGGTCGAVTGALMVIGLKHGRTEVDDLEAKAAAYALAQAFMARFEDRHGSLACRELLGLDLSDPEDHRHAEAQGLFNSRCPAFVRDAASLLEDLVDG